MHFIANQLYHIYNKANVNRLLFHSDADYNRFLNSAAAQIKPYCDILSWCLMPNHFHFLIYANEQSILEKKVGGNSLQQLTNGFKIMLSSYANAQNKKEAVSGNLFQQKTKANLVDKEHYPLTVFHYLHQNAYKAGLVTKIEQWPYSSFPDYAGFRNGTLINKELAIELLGLEMSTFYEDSYRAINFDMSNW